MAMVLVCLKQTRCRELKKQPKQHWQYFLYLKRYQNFKYIRALNISKYKASLSTKKGFVCIGRVYLPALAVVGMKA